MESRICMAGALALAVLTSVLAMGCGGSSSHGSSGGGGGGSNVTGGGPTSLTITKVSGDNQSTPDGTALPDSLVVSVTDQNGNPVSGASVAFALAAPNGSVQNSTATTGSNGEASATPPVLNGGTGTYSVGVEAGLGSVKSTTIGFTETATATSLAIAKTSGDGQTFSVGSSLTLTIAVVDQANQPVAGASVTFTTSGGGSASVLTGVNGQASASISASSAGTVTTTASATLGSVTSNTITFTDTAQ